MTTMKTLFLCRMRTLLPFCLGPHNERKVMLEPKEAGVSHMLCTYMTTLFTASLGNAPQPFFLQWGQSSFLCVLRHGSKKAWDSNLSATSVRPKKRHPNVTAVSKIPSGSKKAWDSNLSAISVEGVRPKKATPKCHCSF